MNRRAAALRDARHFRLAARASQEQDPHTGARTPRESAPVANSGQFSHHRPLWENYDARYRQNWALSTRYYRRVKQRSQATDVRDGAHPDKTKSYSPNERIPSPSQQSLIMYSSELSPVN